MEVYEIKGIENSIKSEMNSINYSLLAELREIKFDVKNKFYIAIFIAFFMWAFLMISLTKILDILS